MEYLIVRNPDTVRNFDVIAANFKTDEYNYVNRNLTFDEAVDIRQIVTMGDMIEDYNNG